MPAQLFTAIPTCLASQCKPLIYLPHPHFHLAQCPQHTMLAASVGPRTSSPGLPSTTFSPPHSSGIPTDQHLQSKNAHSTKARLKNRYKKSLTWSRDLQSIQEARQDAGLFHFLRRKLSVGIFGGFPALGWDFLSHIQ